ncbi:hypothetical protein GF343_02845 [Candidatus Woesearchaeota archaeon]|nr:hypothetical protein [Candidatus Woesearchaeota archaeon]
MLVFKEMRKQFKNPQTGQLILDSKLLKKLKKQGVDLIKVDMDQVFYYSDEEFLEFFNKHVQGNTDSNKYTLLIKADGSAPTEEEAKSAILAALLSPWQAKTNKLGHTYYEIPLPRGFLAVDVQGTTRSPLKNGIFLLDARDPIKRKDIAEDDRRQLDTHERDVHPVILHVEHLIVAVAK